jgi:Zn-dependent protease with chaperone function
MDFFEAQDRARQRSSRLVILFSLAVAGIIAATYAAVVLVQRLTAGGEAYGHGQYAAAALPPWWQPQVLAGVAVVTTAIVAIASLAKWAQFSAGGRAVAESVGARHVQTNTADPGERRLLNVVEEMSIASGAPVPAVYVLDDEAGLNAFAAGLTPNDAVVAVTRGALAKLTRDELQGVVAHEFSHILNGDMRLNVRLTALIFGILVLGLIGRGIVWSIRMPRRSRGKGGGGIAVVILLGVALMFIGYIGYFFGRVIQAAVSRQREYLADASAVQFTRNPTGIAGALKKIGGYAIGSSLDSRRSTELGHFFFAQAFRSGFTGLWSTHPPLVDRIQAIEPAFDGKFFEPPTRVDVARESFVSAGLAKAAPAASPPPLPVPPRAFTPAAALTGVEAIGTLTPAQIANAHLLLEAIPARLRDAAHVPAEAPLLVYTLLLDGDSAIRDRQRKLIQQRRGDAEPALLGELESAVPGLNPGARLPLLQLALPALREIPAAELPAFLDTLDELVHADARVSPFEFALQKLLVHTLELGRKPGAAVVQYYSFTAVADDISVVLSALAGAATRDAAFAPQAFAAGAAHLKQLEGRVRFQPAAVRDLTLLDGALDKLADASFPIKQRTLIAAAHVVSADGQVSIGEFELLRAIAAALDCPMPPLAAQAAPAPASA